MPTMIKRTAQVMALVLLGVLMLGMSTWGMLALLYWEYAAPLPRNALAAAYAGASLLPSVLSRCAAHGGRQWPPSWRSLRCWWPAGARLSPPITCQR